MNWGSQIGMAKILRVALFLTVLPLFVRAQKRYSAGDYYYFNVRYYNRDSTTFENSYMLKERDLHTFSGKAQAFRGFAGGMIEDSTWMICKPLPATGLGIRLPAMAEDFYGYQVRVFSRRYNSYNIYDSSAVSVIAIGIHPGNADSFEYRIVINDTLIYKDWSSFKTFKIIPETGYRYASPGNFCFYRKYMVLEIRDKRTKIINAGIVVNWPVPASLSLEQTRIYFKDNNRMGKDGYLDANLLKKGYAKDRDSMTGVLQQLKLPGDKEYLYAIFDFNNVQQSFGYKALLVRNVDGKTDTTDVGFYFNEPSIRISHELFEQPGRYQLLVGNTYFFNSYSHKNWLLEIPFEVLPQTSVSKKYSLIQLAPYILGILLLLAGVFYSYYRYNKNRLKKAEQARQGKQLQLRNLQNQLNPHFLFNALSAIQNLIVKKDFESASRYLSDFSSLTRTILESSGEELVSLEDELAMLKSYLQMEQLRIPFEYDIIADKEIDVVNGEVPTMLLQPFVENAVKHGIAPLKDGGRIKVEISRSDGSLIFSIHDNCHGIQEKQTDINNTGMGISMFRERVRLLNDMLGSEIITWHFQSNENGTTVTIQLKDWLI